MIGVGEHHRSTHVAQIVGVEALHGRPGGHRHEGGGLDGAVGGYEQTPAGRTIRGGAPVSDRAGAGHREPAGVGARSSSMASPKERKR